MLPNIERGTSFKGVTAYLMHDKREGAADKLATSNRVGFTEVLNFIGDEARDPFEASKLMAMTVRDAEIIKQTAGIKPGGRKAEKPTVWHTSLAWHPDEDVNRQEMMRAVEGCLEAVGLGLDKGYQTYVVQHTDEPQAHVHIVVNLVHPTTGKQANPYRDQPKAQAWGLKYEQERGQIYCLAREDKYGGRTPEQAAFNAAAKGGPETERTKDRFGRNRDREARQPRTARPNEGDEADKIRTAIRARYASLERASKAAFERRRSEASEFYQTRRDGRDAIYRQYGEALDSVWQRPEKVAAPSVTRHALNRLEARRQTFERRERSLLGRYTNASKLAPRAGFLGVIALALNAEKRRRQFERSQRSIKARHTAPGDGKDRPDSKKAQSERLKVMRAAELSAFDRATATLTADMKGRHAADIEGEKAARADLAHDAAAAWRDHTRMFADEPDGSRITDDPTRVIEALTEQNSTFTRADLSRFIGKHVTDPRAVKEAIARVEAAPELVRLGKDDQGRDRFTAHDLQGIERGMMNDVLTLKGLGTHPVSGPNQDHALRALTLKLDPEQEAAFQHVMGPAGIGAVIGYAGSGKSTMLGAARAAWEGQGFRVRGAALSGIATDGLQAGAGIDSTTIHKQLAEWDRGKDLLTAKDVLVVDEAGMIGSRLMARLVSRVEEAGAKIVLVGDPEQLQAIDAGAAFRAIVERTGAAEITSIRRQRDGWQKDATKELAGARVGKALGRYEAAGMIHGHAGQDDAKAALIGDWDRARRSEPGKTQIILAYTRDDVRELNELGRQLRRSSGEIGPDHRLQTAQGERAFAERDRIYFLKNDRGLGVRNGTLGTIEAIRDGRLTVSLDGGRQVSFSTAEYAHIDHGYAATVHKSQGITVDRTHVLATKLMDRHAAYVGLTRHRDRVDIHWSKEAFGNRAGLSRAFSRRRAKDTSLDYEGRDRPADPENLAREAAPEFREDEQGKTPEAPHREAAAQGDTVGERQPWTPEERAAAIAQARADRERREARERAQGLDRDPGREFGL